MTPCVWGVSFTFNSGTSAIEFDIEIVTVIVSLCMGCEVINKLSLSKSTSFEFT